MPTIQEELRDAVLKKLEVFPDIKEILEDDLNIIFNKNLTSMLDEGDHQGKKLKPITFKSLEFKGLFKEGVDVVSEIEKLQLLDIRTLHNFLSRPKGKNETTYDFFSVFLGYSGWLDFRSRYLNQKGANSSKEQSVITPKELTDSETEISIVGTTTINENFVNRIKSGQTYTKEEFYTAKQNDDCQWFGIASDYDVVRLKYDRIKQVIEESIYEDRTYKVAAIIHGDGGCGKSTILRRLAIDFHQKDFQVIWLNDTFFDDFVLTGLHQIERNPSVKFLLIIEDWYRTVSHSSYIHRFLDVAKSNRLRNIRIVVGDRVIDGNLYKKQVLRGSTFLLDSSENEYLLTEIIKKHNDWSSFYKRPLAIHESFRSSSLFVLLFIIASAYDQKIKSIDLREPEKAFQNIINSDFKRLAKRHLGLAKALYDTALIYSTYRATISYNAFLLLADNFFPDRASIRYQNLNLNCEELRLLRKYIHLSMPTKGNAHHLVKFNHDLLVIPGLINVEYDKWDGLNDMTKYELLELFTTIGDRYTSSVFLSKMLENEPHFFANENEKLAYINRLIERGNWHQGYLMNFIRLDLDRELFVEYANKIFDEGIYSNFFWLHYLKQRPIDLTLKTKLIELLFKNQKVNNRVPILLHFQKDQRIKQLAKTIIQKASVNSEINDLFVGACLDICYDPEVKRSFCIKLLQTEDVLEIVHPEIILLALKILKKHNTLKDFCETVFNENVDIDKTHNDIFIHCIKISDVTYSMQLFFERLLKPSNFALDIVNAALLVVSLKKCTDLDLKQHFSDWLLCLWAETPIVIGEDLLSSCIRYCSEKILKKIRALVTSIEVELSKT